MSAQVEIDTKKLAWRFARHIFKANKIKNEIEKNQKELKENQKVVISAFAPLAKKSYDLKILLTTAINNPENAKELLIKYNELLKEYEKEKETIRKQVELEIIRIKELHWVIKELEARLYYHIRKANDDVVAIFNPEELEKEQ